MPLNVDENGLDWCVYWLQDPDPANGAPFYVGCTAKPAQRLSQHCGDPTSPAYHRCREIIAAGRRPVLSILAKHALKEYALAQETAMITEFADSLVNRSAYRASRKPAPSPGVSVAEACADLGLVAPNPSGPFGPGVDALGRPLPRP